MCGGGRARAGSGTDPGATVLEYAATVVVAAVLCGGLLAFVPNPITPRVKAALCHLTHGPHDASCGKGRTGRCTAFCPTKDNPIHPSDPVTAATKGGYAALGDSYSSGEGSNSAGGNYVTSPDGDYLGDSGKDGCHRSPHALSQDLLKKYTFQGGSSFVACSGATTGGLQHGMHGERSQLDALNQRTSLVTLSIGGNDLHFSKVLASCVLDTHIHLKFWEHKPDRCQAQRGQISRDMDHLFGSPPSPSRYQQTLIKVHERAPNARILVVGYPHLFPIPPAKGYVTITKSDQRFLNNRAAELDTKIAQQVQALDNRYYGHGRRLMGSFEYVDNWDALKGHEITTDDPWLNGIEYCPVINWRHNQNCHSALWGKPSAGTGTFHPTPAGQRAFERNVARQVREGPSRTLYDP